MFDVAIIGGGPAGLAAALYLARQKYSIILLTGTIGGQVLWSADVENYLGFHLLDGVDLVKKFKKHLDDYSEFVTWNEGCEVRHVEKEKEFFRLVTDKEDFNARTVLIATGTKHRPLRVPGEDALYGKGVTYCATCDAPLFFGKSVHVVGGGNSAMDAALFAEKYASRVTLVTINPSLTGDALFIEKIKKSKNIQVYTSTKITKILGKNTVVGIGLVGPDGEERTDQTDGVLIEIGTIPVSDFIDFVEKDRKGQIVIDKHNATNVEGIWAAGDVTDVMEKQIAIAVGEGVKAALAMIQYLNRMTR